MKKLLFICYVIGLLSVQSISAQVVQPPVDEPCRGCDGGGGGGAPRTYGILAPNTADNSGNALILFEGNYCTQDEVLRHPLQTERKTFNVSYLNLNSENNVFFAAIAVWFGVGPNDETRSLALQGVKAGRVIEFYDDPYGSKSDDWVEILVKQDVLSSDRYLIYSYEFSYEDDFVKVTYHKDNGLDGKISYINTFMAY
jgi:hypothetical protein